MAAPRVMLIHSAAEPITPDTPAHVFGPFETYEEALAFDLERPDSCVSWFMDLVGPAPDDVDRSSGPDAHANHEREGLVH